MINAHSRAGRAGPTTVLAGDPAIRLRRAETVQPGPTQTRTQGLLLGLAGCRSIRLTLNIKYHVSSKVFFALVEAR